MTASADCGVPSSGDPDHVQIRAFCEGSVKEHGGESFEAPASMATPQIGRELP